MSDEQKPRALSIGEKLFLLLLVPALMVLALEGACRLFKTEALFAKTRGELDLEMPTWMQNDPNLTEKVKSVSGDEASIDWLSMFEEGDGYRVRLIPRIERSVTNTFSQIAADKLQKYFVKANSLGFRGPELAATKDPAVERILVFGDSSSFGWGVNQDETFSALLPALLQVEPGRRIEVGNFAIPGDSSEYGRLIFEHFAAQYHPDLVILGFGANDAKLTFFQHPDQVERFSSQIGAQRVRHYLRYSALFRTMEAVLTPSKEINQADLPERKPAVPKRRFIENLKYMSERSLELGARGVLLLSLCTPANYSSRVEELASNHNFLYLNGQKELIREIPNIAKGAIHPDLVDEMRASYGDQLRSQPLFFVTSDACHPNKLGHRMVAERVAEKLNSSGLLLNSHDSTSRSE